MRIYRESLLPHFLLSSFYPRSAVLLIINWVAVRPLRAPQNMGAYSLVDLAILDRAISLMRDSLSSYLSSHRGNTRC